MPYKYSRYDPQQQHAHRLRDQDYTAARSRRADRCGSHDLAHIKHRDTLISSVVATIAGALTMLAQMAQWALLFGGLGGSDEDDGGSLVMISVGRALRRHRYLTYIKVSSV